MIQNVPLKQLRIDGGTQPRVALNQEVVAEYAEYLDDDRELPPAVAFFDGSHKWLAGGFHRYFAYQKRDRASMPCEVRNGTQRDAILFSLGTNADHGLRRSTEDKRKVVRTMLDDPEWGQWSDREIAKACAVSHTFVASVRNPVTAQKRSENRAKSAAKQVEPAPPAPPPPAAPPAPPTEAEKVAQEAHGDTDIVELLDETQRELESAQKTIAAMREDDKAAAIEKWQRLADVAQRRQGELQDAVKKRDDELKWYQRQLNRICKAVGEDDPAKVAAVVEAMVRSQKKVPA